MARRNSSTLDAPEGTENTEAPEVENTEALEAAVEAEVETPAEDTPTTEGETPAAESDGERDTSGDTVITDGEKEADLAPFIAASQATVAQRDTSEGEDQPEAPKVPAEVVAAFKFARGAKRRGVGTGNGDRTPHDGPRRDLGKHIAEAFADVESGTFLSVAEIRKFKSSEYEDEPPSAGAISARLFPAKGECTVEGITPGTGGEKGTKGAYKA
jgi:hypothetical protein